MELKVETPKNIDKIFSLDCFKFNDMKDLFKDIYMYLTKFALKMTDLEEKLNAIPDFSELMQKVRLIENKCNNNEKKFDAFKNEYEAFKDQISAKVDANYEEIIARLNNHEERIVVLEKEVDILKKRPIATGGPVDIDYDAICSKEEFLDLLQRVKMVEKRNLEQDDRLTNNELRIEELEKKIMDPMERIMALEERVNQLYLELQNKVNVQDLYNELTKKADLNGLKALEASLIRLNDLINDLANQFADRIENDKAHKLLQKNLKNLYDLFMSLKGEGTEDDPMFTTKGLMCASCAKGV